MAAGWSYFASFPQTAIAFAEFAKTKLTIPLLCVGGAKANGKALAAQCKIVGSDVTVETIEDAGHWLLEEKPQQTIAAIDGFLK